MSFWYGLCAHVGAARASRVACVTGALGGDITNHHHHHNHHHSTTGRGSSSSASAAGKGKNSRSGSSTSYNNGGGSKANNFNTISSNNTNDTAYRARVVARSEPGCLGDTPRVAFDLRALVAVRGG
jgi:hypothetical protein